MKKDEIRKRVRARKSLLTSADRERASRAVFSVIEQSAAFVLADNILLYHSLPDELPTLEFIDRWHSRKNFFLPRVNGLNLEILPYHRSRLHLGSFNIEEPDGDDTTDISAIDLIIVPGVAYDRRGNRVGRGKGYYDRLLRETPAVTIGVGYDFQLVDEIDCEPHDVPVDIVITESDTVLPHPDSRARLYRIR